MKILIFTPQFYQIGGQERLSIELAIELNRSGIHTDLLCQHKKDIEVAIDIERDILTSGVPKIHYLGFSRRDGILAFFTSIFRLRKLVTKEGYTAIEVSGFTPSLLTALSFIERKVKVVQGIHQMLSDQHSGSLRYKRWKYLWLLTGKTTLYAISESSRRGWCKYIGVGCKRIVTILNSIHSKFFYIDDKEIDQCNIRKQIGAAQNSKLVLFVGRLMKSKGVDTLYDALKEKLVSNDLHLIFVGREDSAESQDDINLITKIKREIAFSPWRERVHLLGERTDVVDIMAECDVLIHPARCEGFGLVLAEALAVGIPIIASNIDGIPEVLAGTDSIMISPDNLDQLTEATLDVLNWSQAKLSLAIIRGKKRSEAFRPEKRVNAILDLLKS